MAIDIPNFPTESLHKFRAIVGLVMMFGGIIYLVDGLSTVQERIIDVNTKVKILEIKTRGFKNNADFETLEITVAQLRGENKKAEFLLAKLGILLVVNTFVAAYGFYLARLGFRKWQEIQDVTDEVLKKELKE